MIPFYFGDSKSALFGALSEPTSATPRGHCVLVCPPIGHEHVRTHWALRQLANALNRQGFHVLRFDWFGVGDSAGSLEEASLERFLDDVKTAAAELCDTTGIRRLSIVGLRLGAAFAALAAPAIAPHALVLWDPVVNGASHGAALHALQRDIVADEKRFFYAWPSPARHLLARLRPAFAQHHNSRSNEFAGFVMPDALLAQLGAITPGQLAGAARGRLGLVSSADDHGCDELAVALTAANVAFEKRAVAVEAAWHDAAQVEELLLPGATSNVITTLLMAST